MLRGQQLKTRSATRARASRSQAVRTMIKSTTIDVSSTNTSTLRHNVPSHHHATIIISNSNTNTRCRCSKVVKPADRRGARPQHRDDRRLVHAQHTKLRPSGMLPWTTGSTGGRCACKRVGTKLPRARSGSQLGWEHGASRGIVHRWRAVYRKTRDAWIPYREHDELRQARRCSAEEVGELPVWVQRVVHVTCSLSVVGVVTSTTGCRHAARPESRRRAVASG